MIQQTGKPHDFVQRKQENDRRKECHDQKTPPNHRPITAPDTREHVRGERCGNDANDAGDPGNDAAVQEVAIGGSAVRLNGEGPTSGEVVSVVDGELTLALRRERVQVPAENYGLRVNSGFVRHHHNSEILRRLQVASGSLTQMGRRNRFQVKDRFAGAVEDLDVLGFEFNLIGGGSAEIEARWIEVRRQDSE